MSAIAMVDLLLAKVSSSGPTFIDLRQSGPGQGFLRI
jgi:hypothetical protein